MINEAFWKRGGYILLHNEVMQIFQIHRGKGTDAYYLQQFRNDNVSKAAAFYCKYRMFSYNICLTLYTALITVNVEDICIETFF